MFTTSKEGKTMTVKIKENEQNDTTDPGGDVSTASFLLTTGKEGGIRFSLSGCKFTYL